MIHAKSESDVTSLEMSPRSSSNNTSNVGVGAGGRAVYYVQSPSRDSHDDKSSSRSNQPTPSDSPTHPSSSSHSNYFVGGRHSSSSRVSGYGGRRNKGGWGRAEAIEEEEGGEEEEEISRDELVSRRFHAGLVGVAGFCGVFFVFCLIIWGASRPFNPRVVVQRVVVHSFSFSQGSDRNGVPTKLMTINCSLTIRVHNPATFYGIHVSSHPVILKYSDLPVATGELQKYFQPRESHRNVTVWLHGANVPLYGAGATLELHQVKVPMTLAFVVRSRGDVVGKLVKSRHKRQVSCPLVIDSNELKPLEIKGDSCAYGLRTY